MTPGSPGTVQAWLEAFLGDRWAGASPATATFAELGLDSLELVAMCRAAQDWLGRPVPAVWALRHPTPSRLAAALELTPTNEGRLLPVSVGTEPNEPIAIVGMSVRAPGGVVDLDGLWQLLCEGVDAVGPVPHDRWDVDAVARVDDRVPRVGGFLDGVDGFDPAFFRISAREAEDMDPLQFMALELAWEGLEHAGIVASRLGGADVGVFMGAVQSDFAALVHERTATRYTSTGSHLSLVSNRISYALGLTGPSMVIDSACSSSLVAVHLACQAIRAGDCRMAIAGGVHLQLSPFASVCLTRLGGLSPRGRCRTFDAGADGFVRGEGGGIVVLKPLGQALADGDVVHGLVAGSAVNNDGGGNGLTSPSPRAQASLVRRALRAAGCTASQVGYLEAHGTGTPLGDAVEVEALAEVFGGREEPVRVGSAKTNFGHLEGAAGILGLLKATLSCKHGRFVPTLHVVRENPQLDMSSAGLEPCTENTPWNVAPERRIAGVSSFGFGGTNAHVIVRAASEAPVPDGHDERPSHHGEQHDAGTVFVYAGVGHQRLHMGRELVACRPGFRDALQELDAHLEPHLGASVFELLRTTDDAWTRDPFLYHPMLFALQVGLTRVLAHSGIVPSAVIGHSMGEYAAAVAAGVLSLRDACMAVCVHSRAVSRLDHVGAMAVVGAGADETAALIADVGVSEAVEVAGENGPASTVVSGAAAAVERVLERAGAREIWAVPANVGYAAHSRAIEGIRDELLQGMHGLRPRHGHTPMFSATAVRWVRGPEVGAAYWFANLRGRVRFSEALRELVVAGYGCFLELSPHPSLLGGRNTADLEGRFIPSLWRGESEDRCLRAAFRSIDLPAADATRVEPVTCVSARSWPAVRAAARRLARWWTTHAQVDASDLAYNATTRREHFDHRVAIVGADRVVVSSALRQVADEGPSAIPFAAKAPRSAPEVCFVFPGQGGAWRGLSTALLQRPIVRRTVDACARAFAELGVDFDGSTLQCRLARAEGRIPVHERQPMNFAVALAVAELMRSEGIEPTRVVGHSQGEVAAAAFTGALSLRDGAAVVAERSRQLRTLSGTGAMALVELHGEEVGEDPLAVLGLAGVPGCVVAARNSPLTVVIAGSPSVLAELGAACEAAGRFFRVLDVEVASHSDAVRGLVPSLRRALASVVAHEPTIPWMSTVDVEFIRGRRADAEYWCRNLCEPVSFSDAIAALESRGSCVFVEASAHPILSPSIERGLHHRGSASTVAAGLRRDVSPEQSLAELRARLFCEGVEVKWGPVFPEGGTRLPLPTYPWQRRRFPLPRGTSPIFGGSKSRAEAGADAGNSSFVVERGRWAAIDDHTVAGDVVVPAAVYCAWMAAAWRRAAESSPSGICFGDLMFPEALRVDADARHRVQVIVTLDGAAEGDARVVTVADDGTVLAEHARARVRSASADELRTLPPTLASSEPSVVEGETFYRKLDARGHGYGDSLARVDTFWEEGRGCRVRLRSAGRDEDVLDAGGTVMGAVLDAALQAAVYMMPGETAVVAAGIERVVWHREPRPGQPLDVRLELDGDGACAAMEACDSDGLFVQVRGLRLVTVDSGRSGPLRAPLERRWEEWPEAIRESTRRRCLVIGREEGLASQLCAALLRRGALTERIDAEPSVAETTHVAASRSGRDLVVVDVRPFDAAWSRAPAESTRWAPLTDALELAARLARMTDGIRLHFVTAGGVSPHAAAVQGAVLGFARAASYEHPELRCGRVELRGTPTRADLERLADVVSGQEVPGECILEAGRVRVPRLRSLPVDTASSVELKSDATYVVTGGHGVLGLEAARWLAGCGARRLLLLSRRGERPSVQGVLDELRDGGVEVVSLAIDLADAAAVRAAFVSAERPEAPVRGIIHAAGILGDRFLLDLDANAIIEALVPKVSGGEHVLAAVSTPLDFLVLYSSVAGWLGLPGQAGYCAANGGLDALAVALREAGHPAVSIAWGSFGRGLAAGAARGERLEAQGLGRISIARHEELLALAVTAESASIGAFDLDASRWLEAHPQISPHDLGLPPRRREAASRSSDPPADPTRVVFGVICEVLRCRPGDLDVDAPFSELGLDSMGALEMRNRLERRLGRPVSITLIWSHPSPAALAAALDERVTAATEPVADERSRASAGPSGDDAALARFLDAFEDRRRSRS